MRMIAVFFCLFAFHHYAVDKLCSVNSINAELCHQLYPFLSIGSIKMEREESPQEQLRVQLKRCFDVLMHDMRLAGYSEHDYVRVGMIRYSGSLDYLLIESVDGRRLELHKDLYSHAYFSLACDETKELEQYRIKERTFFQNDFLSNIISKLLQNSSAFGRALLLILCRSMSNINEQPQKDYPRLALDPNIPAYAFFEIKESLLA